MNRNFEISEVFKTTPENLYNAWLNSEKHSLMTGGEAICSSETGGKFTAWDGYISGSNIQIEPFVKIVQSWRTTEFKNSDNDSEITLLFEESENGTKLTLIHTNIPDGQPDYEQGWKDHYFTPMKEHFK